MTAFSWRRVRICQTSVELSNSPADPICEDASQTWRRIDSSCRCCMTGNIDGNWRVKRQAGPSWPLARALEAAPARADSGRPASFVSSVMTSSHALVESRTCSEYSLVILESSASMAAMRSFSAAGKSAPELRKSANVSSTKRCWTAGSVAISALPPTALITAHKRSFRASDE